MMLFASPHLQYIKMDVSQYTDSLMTPSPWSLIDVEQGRATIIISQYYYEYFPTLSFRQSQTDPFVENATIYHWCFNYYTLRNL